MREADLNDKDVKIIDKFLLTLSLLKVCIDERRKIDHCLSVKHSLCLEICPETPSSSYWENRYWVIDHVSYDLDY